MALFWLGTPLGCSRDASTEVVWNNSSKGAAPSVDGTGSASTTGGFGAAPGIGASANGASAGTGGTNEGQNGGSGSGGTGSGGMGGALEVSGTGGKAPSVTDCQTGQPCAGYTLLGSPENDAGADFDAFLIDMDGNIVHSWSISGFPPKMLPGGSLIGCSGVHSGTYDCVQMQQLSWDNDVEWSFADWETTGSIRGARQHHDYFRGNRQLGYYAPGVTFDSTADTYVLAHTLRTVPELGDRPIDDDVIYRVTPDGMLGEVLWYGADHYDEFGFDDEALADIAGRNPNGKLEWLHGNSITPVGPNRFYDEGNEAFHPDNIIYSSRIATFVAILHRETGEVVWKMGPDYDAGPEQALGQVQGQHHPHLIPQGLPGAGNMLVYDNGPAVGFGGPSVGENRYPSRGYSRVIEFDPTTFEVAWQYGTESGDEFFFSALVSNTQRLPNGNTLITIGLSGRVIEVTKEKEIVWEHQYVPTSSGNRAQWIYRAFRIPPEWLPEGEGTDYETWAAQYE